MTSTAAGLRDRAKTRRARVGLGLGCVGFEPLKLAAPWMAPDETWQLAAAAAEKAA